MGISFPQGDATIKKTKKNFFLFRYLEKQGGGAGISDLQTWKKNLYSGLPEKTKKGNFFVQRGTWLLKKKINIFFLEPQHI